MGGAESQVWSGTTLRPLAQVTTPSCCATVKTSTSSPGCCSDQAARTSHGPAQSSSSAPSNNEMPMRVVMRKVYQTLCVSEAEGTALRRDDDVALSARRCREPHLSLIHISEPTRLRRISY